MHCSPRNPGYIRRGRGKIANKGKKSEKRYDKYNKLSHPSLRAEARISKYRAATQGRSSVCLFILDILKD